MKLQSNLSIFSLTLLLILSTHLLKSQSQKRKTIPAKASTRADTKTMYVKGRYLYSAAGEKVILRGVNEMIIWSGDHTGKNVLQEISKTGANSVRLVWTTEGDSQDLNMLIKNCLKNKMIPIVELHDATGDWEKLDKVISYWMKPEIKKIIDEHKKWVLVNIANEVGNDTPDSVFVSKYKNAITKLRNFGYTVPLIIDASSWGKDEKQIARTWRQLFEHDPLRNAIFSVHTYWVEDDSKEKLNTFLKQVVKDTIPLIFGEGPQPFGWDCKTAFPYIYCMKKCQELEIGWLAWSWGQVKNGDCKTNGGYDITPDGLFGNWNSDWSRSIMVNDPNSIKNTSKRPESILNYQVE